VRSTRAPAELTRTRVVVGGVAHLYQGDLDIGRVVVERLGQEGLGPHVSIEEFTYGAVAVAQRLQELKPDLLVLVGAKARGRATGTVERREVSAQDRSPAELQAAIADAITGHIDLDLVLEVAQGLGALPPKVIAIELEPASTAPSEHLSREASLALERVVQLVRAEL
jgi:hydrogenase maturation protease